jgi:hypothetical protein
VKFILDELLRIIFIVLILGGLLGSLLQNIYRIFGYNINNYGWIASVGIYILLFVLYRNKFQFSGWYKGKNRKKLPKKVSQILIGCSILLFILPVILRLLFK